MADTFIAVTCYRGTFFEHRENILGKICLLIANTIWLVRKKENTYTFLFNTFLYFNTKVIIQFFQVIFHPCCNSCIFIKKIVYKYFPIHKKLVYRYLESQSNTTIHCFSSRLYINLIICKLKKFGSHFSLV